MTSPLAPAREASLNRDTPPSKRKYDQYEVRAFTTSTTVTTHQIDSPNSSPFVPTVEDGANLERNNTSPSKARHSRVISGTELSPLKILSEHKIPPGVNNAAPAMGPPPQRSPRRVSPVSRFPVKINPHGDVEHPVSVSHERKVRIAEMMRDNDGLKKAIEIFEDEKTGIGEEVGLSENPPATEDAPGVDHDESAGPDDTMTSTFSTFSVVPNLAVFSKLGHSPLKNATFGSTAPRTKLQRGPIPETSPARERAIAAGSPSELLMDFTDQMRFPRASASPGTRGRLPPSSTMPNVSATPDRHSTHLIDFDIPPMPTPRSLPTITPRELESLKSKFLSEISALKASLSGKEAEVQSLKTAVGDAEKRVGESTEQMREERAAKEQLCAEKDAWERRGREVEGVLGKMKGEVVTGQREKEELEQKLEESEKRREAAEMLHQEAESKMAGMRAGKECEKMSAKDASGSPGRGPKAAAASGATTTTREVEMAVERVARELHALYKGKHETKVAALKKSYESRWEKRVKELESRIQEVCQENEVLRDRETQAAPRFDPDATTVAVAEERKAQAVKDGAVIKELGAEIQRLEAVVSTVKRDNRELRTMLEKERVEKGELVQLAEEMMSMQSIVVGPSSQQQQNQNQRRQDRAEHLTAAVAKTPKASSSSSSSSGELLARSSSVGRGVGVSGSVGLPRPGGGPRSSGLVSSIERMGNYRGRGALE
ncbi:hypothetical protein AAL_07781 [Moelleriella libera RCEF 2490]|uniref:Kinetoplast-associated protein KAP n=1 Tax=Moelleriella libera RCEF 2490 TaxID=1081109 RepID=A0A162I661_9HYPO|nr:hypothetical protein AAL_07781 [Moelleriella libera RCEF 2490]